MRSRLPGATMFAIAWLALVVPGCGTSSAGVASTGTTGASTLPDVKTDTAGLGYAGFCHGSLCGDIDNDGDQDVILCNYGPNVLFLNNGDGTFTDISKAAGIDRPGWSSGGAFLDYDNDGDLDVYIANYGEWKYPEDDRFCTDHHFLSAPGKAKARLYVPPPILPHVTPYTAPTL